MRDWVRSWSATARLIGVGLSVVVAFVGAIWVLNHLSAHLIHSLFPARYVRLGEAILDTCVACVAALVMYLLLLRHLVLWKKVKRQERRWEDLREHEMKYERGMDTG